ncbi:hypothetical protein SAMD00019534_065810 [Acytostelium subglobosum LB1]|uniref:hypothetical protein n=1 Tax=Acytostelium subglobosum LB1 TaxID=1410327 RepID=UPI000644F69F|nr:hypothetical protein SAMD00019534_065810 [Acytostelium subglobosum LB1]GAM23406.1 hypothetical protein SAMD00019534_065810 [Acytostelium subglobosum LB1]|eukprot:XP_012753855.1 hypothetical protein SAMD00019534_065810 [Acytostelium subglobosum LB1]
MEGLNDQTKPGDTVSVTFNNKMVIKPVVAVVEPNHQLRWRGKLWFTGLFDGEHFFQAVNNNDGSTKFVHGENFSGILVPLLGSLITKTEGDFNKMNEELKKRVEAPAVDVAAE